MRKNNKTYKIALFIIAFSFLFGNKLSEANVHSSLIIEKINTDYSILFESSNRIVGLINEFGKTFSKATRKVKYARSNFAKSQVLSIYIGTLIDKINSIKIHVRRLKRGDKRANGLKYVSNKISKVYSKLKKARKYNNKAVFTKNSRKERKNLLRALDYLNSAHDILYSNYLIKKITKMNKYYKSLANNNRFK